MERADASTAAAVGSPSELPRSAPFLGALTPRRAFLGCVLAGFVLSIGNAIDIAVSVPFPGLGLRLLHHVTDLVENVALGTLAGALVALSLTYARRGTVLVTMLAAAPIVHAASGHTIWRKLMIWFDGKVEWSLYVPIVALESLAASLLFVMGHRLGGFRRAWAIAPALALPTLVVNDLVQPDQFFGDHGVVACAASLFAGAALARHFEARFDRWSARRFFIAVTPLLLFALVPPSNAMRLELFKVPSSVGAWALATAWWRNPSVSQDVAPRDLGPWLVGRSGVEPIPPSTATLTSGAPIVVLITIDAMRADVVNEAPLPELRAMSASGARFTNAITPGSQTAVSLATVFSGRYFSQLHWDLVGTGAKRFLYPAADSAPRFPELLTAAGISTTLVAPVVFLNAETGVARGFSDHRVLVEDTSHVHGARVIDMLVDRIRAADPNRPAFFYAHLIEPHHPYDRGAKTNGAEFERYVSEIELADELVARAARAIEARFDDRAILIVTSDHAESFGEHGTWQHSKTVYDEVLRVPLLVRGGRVRPRTIDAPVGIVDLGPTILDLFRLPTPPSFMGQSLVPLLAGEPATLTRPLFAEARLHRAYYGELKIIEDERRHTVEAYDLTKDPKELHNVYGADPRAEPDLATLRAFFKDAPLVYRQ